MNEPIAYGTVAIIIVTVVFSVMGFRRPDFCERYLFSVREVLAEKQFYRLVTSAFLHADVIHLTLNMVCLYLFGRQIEWTLGIGRFLLIYFAAIVGGGLLSLLIHRRHDYRAYGASGGACGLVFSFIILFPGSYLSGFLLPGSLPGWLYAVLYLVGSFLALRQQADGIGHDAHLGGAIIGFWTTAALEPWTARLEWKLFAGISVLAILLFVYLVKNPLFLPLSTLMPLWGAKRNREPSRKSSAVNEERKLNAVLEKISATGMDSLTPEEKSLLTSVSAKYQRRSDSQKPESDLII